MIRGIQHGYRTVLMPCTRAWHQVWPIGHRFLTASDDHISVSQCDHTAGTNDGTCTTETYFIEGNAVYIATKAGAEGSLSPRVLACASLNYLSQYDGIHSSGGDTSRANSPLNRLGAQIDSGIPGKCPK